MNEWLKIFVRLVVILYGIFAWLIALLLFSVNFVIQAISWFFTESVKYLDKSYGWLYKKVV